MILLTGASGGIGRVVFEEMSKKEFVIGMINKSKLKEIKNTIVIKLDLTSEKNIKNFINENKPLLNQITLIHMATKSIDGLLHSYSLEDLKKTFEVNIIGNFALTKYILPFMMSQKWGRIIHISSIVSHGAVGAGAYASSKSSLVGYSKTLAKEYGRFNITSNIMRLGYFDQGLIDTFSNKKVNEIKNQIPSKKLGKVRDVIKTIKYIQSSNFLNGAVLDLDGG